MKNEDYFFELQSYFCVLKTEKSTMGEKTFLTKNFCTKKQLPALFLKKNVFLKKNNEYNISIISHVRDVPTSSCYSKTVKTLFHFFFILFVYVLVQVI